MGERGREGDGERERERERARSSEREERERDEERERERERESRERVEREIPLLVWERESGERLESWALKRVRIALTYLVEPCKSSDLGWCTG